MAAHKLNGCRCRGSCTRHALCQTGVVLTLPWSNPGGCDGPLVDSGLKRREAAWPHRSHQGQHLHLCCKASWPLSIEQQARSAVWLRRCSRSSRLPRPWISAAHHLPKLARQESEGPRQHDPTSLHLSNGREHAELLHESTKDFQCGLHRGTWKLHNAHILGRVAPWKVNQRHRLPGQRGNEQGQEPQGLIFMRLGGSTAVHEQPRPRLSSRPQVQH
mmetsp:Transcript_10619/g.29411  ORF Transcript_10619/g.29411 Transcript_10619/m.29411 type:complete len:217 (+) Transcript_10619:1572-2222(+)